MDSREDLRGTTLAWAMQFWDYEAHMVWNPPGSFDEQVAARSVHLTPNSAWLAYGLLGSNDAAERAEAVRAIDAIVDIQYDAPGTDFHGTYARVLEAPYPPAQPAMWVDYDPNWRQFVGTTFALIIEDFGDRLDERVRRRVEDSIALACAGEPPSRIDVHYANPALMRAWLDGWVGVRTGDGDLVDRGEAFGRAVVAAHDQHRAFDEFNSPTYYGIDLYALRLWEAFPPTPWFASEGGRVASGLWATAAEFYSPTLRNFCGPFTRSYHPDMTRSVALFSLWLWALLGRDHAPMPPLEAATVDHGHDLMAGPLFARLAAPPAQVDLAAFTTRAEVRDVTRQLNHGRSVTAHVEPDVMLGAESSAIDWGGWSQFMPVTAHWHDGDGIGVLWLLGPRRVDAAASGRSVVFEAAEDALEFRVLSKRAPAVRGDGVVVEETAPGDYRIRVERPSAEDEAGDPVGHERRLVLTLDLDRDGAGHVDGVTLEFDRLGDT